MVTVKPKLNPRPCVLHFYLWVMVRLIRSSFTARHEHFSLYYPGEWFLNPVGRRQIPPTHARLPRPFMTK